MPSNHYLLDNRQVNSEHSTLMADKSAVSTWLVPATRPLTRGFRHIVDSE